MHLLNVATPGSPTPSAHLADFGAETGGVAFSPTARCSPSGRPTTRPSCGTCPTPPNHVRSASRSPGRRVRSSHSSFSGDGRYLAAAVTDNSVWVWDLEDPAEPQAARTTCESSEAQVYGVGFHPSEPLVAAGADTDVRMYTVDRDTAIDAVCASVGDATTDEWKSLMADDRDVAAC